jgi:uncharacterized YigZ family protein
MTEHFYYTIAQATETQLTIKASKFIGYAYPIESQKEAKSLLDQLRNTHPKANHICFAFVLSDGYAKSSDNGEPSGSAGKPMANQLQSKNLKNTMIAVVRYFGGTELGVPGLISAYKNAALNTLNEAEIIQKHFYNFCIIEFPVEKISWVMNIFKKHLVVILEENFSKQYAYTIKVRRSQEAAFFEDLQTDYQIVITQKNSQANE